MTHHSENREKLVELAYRRSNDALQAQAAIANSADQRALVFATASIAAAALVFSALNSSGDEFYAKGAAIFFCVSAIFSVISASPGVLYSAGSRAKDLHAVINGDTTYESALWGICKNNDKDIDDNESAAKWRAHSYRFAIWLFVFGILTSLRGFWQT